MLLSNRSGALLTLGDKSGALEDANAAASLAPPGFHTAYVRQVQLRRAIFCHSTTGKYLLTVLGEAEVVALLSRGLANLLDCSLTSSYAFQGMSYVKFGTGAVGGCAFPLSTKRLLCSAIDAPSCQFNLPSMIVSRRSDFGDTALCVACGS